MDKADMYVSDISAQGALTYLQAQLPKEKFTVRKVSLTLE